MTDHYLQLLIGLAAAAVIAGGAARVRFLNPSGAWGAFILGTIVFGLGGLDWSLPLIVFFITGSLLSKFAPRRRQRAKEEAALLFEKGSTRDAAQVAANGGVAGVIVLIHAFHPDPLLFAAYLGSLAAAAADTWGTELGVMSRGAPFSIITFRRVPPGTSGGISLVGTAGATLGAAMVALSGLGTLSVGLVPSVVIAGIVGMLADSIAGGTVQAHYRCPECGAATERSTHCGVPTQLSGGYRSVTNDVVNIICTIVGGVVGYLLG